MVFNIDHKDKFTLNKSFLKILKSLDMLSSGFELEEEIHHLKEVRRIAVDENLFDEKKYLSSAKRIIEKLIEQKNEPLDLGLIISFSDIHCDLEDIFEAFDLVDKIIQFIGENKYDFTRSNKSFLESCLFTYHYKNSSIVLKEEGIEELINLFNDGMQLLTRDDKEWIIKSILSNLINSNSLNQKEMLKLLDHIDVAFFPNTNKLKMYPTVKNKYFELLNAKH